MAASCHIVNTDGCEPNNEREPTKEDYYMGKRKMSLDSYGIS